MEVKDGYAEDQSRYAKKPFTTILLIICLRIGVTLTRFEKQSDGAYSEAKSVIHEDETEQGFWKEKEARQKIGAKLEIPQKDEAQPSRAQRDDVQQRILHYRRLLEQEKALLQQLQIRQQQMKNEMHLPDQKEQLASKREIQAAVMECKICFGTAINCVFIPCGHLTACYECGSPLRHCPMCRTAITSVVKTFLA